MATKLGSHLEQPPTMKFHGIKTDGNVFSSVEQKNNLLADTIREISKRGHILLCAAFAIVIVCGNTGCKAIMDRTLLSDDSVMEWRDYVWAKRAYAQQRDRYINHPHEKSFKEGFCDGYRSIASGGDGCTPALPPKKYWSWKYQSAEGIAKVNAWYEGFPLGAKAAEQEGVGFYSQVQISRTVQNQYQASRSDEPCLTCPQAPIVSTPAVKAASPVAGAPASQSVFEGQSVVESQSIASRPAYHFATRTTPLNKIERLPAVESQKIRQVSAEVPASDPATQKTPAPRANPVTQAAVPLK